ncbi:sulfate transporter 3.1-like [Prunus yedoensis var. nudiflora]|uniref:Sulfate transporter 3.1-like n=1 Tax=Prunus yedoensis var. nudiflora TaxID=2094558 RepID=A0A314XT88_PRUYE|nr:sulfate transporter 3.1-like [Prunus yedoensis var. nudiflora]
MIAIGMMYVAGSCTSCYLTTGPFPTSAVNYNAGCKTAMSNVVMAIAVMFTLLFLTPLFHYTPLVVLSAIIIAAMLGLIDYEAAIHLWKDYKEDRIKSAGESSLQYVILDMTAVGNIDTSGISMFEEVKKLVDRRGLQLVLANPGSEVMKKMNKSELIEKTCQGWIYLTDCESQLQRLLQHATSCFTPPSPTVAKIKNQLHGTTFDGFGWLQCEFMYQKAIST